MKKSMIVLLLTVAVVFFAGAQNVTISGVDNSTLLVNQQVGVYVSVTDANGAPILGLTEEEFDILESSPWSPEEEREIVAFRQGINMTQGVTMLLLVDNSGSMYYNASGSITESDDESIWRITYAKNAVLSLLKDIENPADRVGFASFNIQVGTVVEPTDDKTKIEAAVNAIEKPGEGQGYTELYEAVYESVESARNAPGRKVIVLLSDGENYPLEDNPNYPERNGLEGAIAFARDEGVSVFTIGLSSGADTEVLKEISSATGGAFYSAYDPADLEQLYSLIRNQILNEYWIAYRSGMEPSEQKSVRVLLRDGAAEAEREYYSATLFGLPQDPFAWLILLAIPLALLLLWLLSRMKFENRQELPSLEVIDVAGKRTRQAMTIAEGKNQITIGGAASADLTIAGDPKVTRMEATITQKDGAFTVAGDSIKVNNRTVRNKKLKAGDTITVGETTVVFDEGTAKTIASGSSKRRTTASKTKSKGPSKTKKR